jgi:hypothetical protein
MSLAAWLKIVRHDLLKPLLWLRNDHREHALAPAELVRLLQRAIGDVRSREGERVELLQAWHALAADAAGLSGDDRRMLDGHFTTLVASIRAGEASAALAAIDGLELCLQALAGDPHGEP